MNQNVNKYFTTKNIIFFIMIVLFLVFLHKIIDIALMFFAAFVFSAALLPIVDKLSKKIPRILATSIILLTFFVITTLIIVPLLIFSVQQGITLLDNLPDMIKNIHSFLSNFKFFGYDFGSLLSVGNITPHIDNIVTNIIGKSFSYTKIAINGVVAIITVSLVIFYLCFDKENLYEWYVRLFPEKLKEKAQNIMNTITNRVGGFLFAQIVTMTFVGVLTAIGLLIIKNPNAIILGFIAGVFDFVPVVGPTLATIIGLFTAIDNGVIYTLGTLLIYLIVQVLENQFLRPIIYGKFMNVHPLVIIISILVGAKFLGFWGIVLGPAMASVICVLLDELYIRPINLEDKNQDLNE